MELSKPCSVAQKKTLSKEDEKVFLTFSLLMLIPAGPDALHVPLRFLAGTERRVVGRVHVTFFQKYKKCCDEMMEKLQKGCFIVSSFGNLWTR